MCRRERVFRSEYYVGATWLKLGGTLIVKVVCAGVTVEITALLRGDGRGRVCGHFPILESPIGDPQTPRL